MVRKLTSTKAERARSARKLKGPAKRTDRANTVKRLQAEVRALKKSLKIFAENISVIEVMIGDASNKTIQKWTVDPQKFREELDFIRKDNEARFACIEEYLEEQKMARDFKDAQDNGGERTVRSERSSGTMKSPAGRVADAGTTWIKAAHGSYASRSR
jgi:hypothetical protein